MVLYSQCFDLLYETYLPLRPNPTLGPTFFLSSLTEAMPRT